MTQAQPATGVAAMNRQQRRRAERAAKKAGRGKANRRARQNSPSSSFGEAAALQQLADETCARGDLRQAADLYGQALRLQPDDATLLQRLGLVLTAAKRYPEALVYLAKAIRANPTSKEPQLWLEQVLAAAPPARYLPELEQALIVCFDSPFLAPKPLAHAAAQQIKLKLQQQARSGGDGDGQVDMQSLSTDELLIRLLIKSVNIDPNLEVLLRDVRRSLLLANDRQSTLSGPALGFAAALARQCHNNSYVFYAEPDEAEALERLARELGERFDHAGKPDAALESRLVLFALYRPLSALLQSESLARVPLAAWSDEIRPLIELTLLDRLEEARLKETIRSIGEIEDDVSRAVQAQYEENPYPRWTALPQLEPRGCADYLRQQFPHFDPPGFLAGPIEVLVAGCGTGQHPVSIARLYSNARITAVDLSRSSLAYATRMAAQYGVQNVEFFQGDILELASLGRQFPVIESSGVLHHLRDPDAGLAVLAGQLRPGGVLNLGLYSERARQWVVAARARIAELGLTPTAENIRAFRRTVLAGEELPGTNFAAFGDFFGLDSCRDLIFHEQEHRFTIPGLRDFLDRQSLRLLGFCFADTKQIERFRKIFPDPAAITDMDCWQRYEEAHPLAFVGMYQFWCQKPF